MILASTGGEDYARGKPCLNALARAAEDAGFEAAFCNMPNPSTALRDYVTDVANWLRRDGPATHLPQQPSPYSVPIYLAALASQNVELAGEIADGVMALWWSVDRVARSRRWIERGRAKSGGRRKLELTLGLSTCIGDDIDALRGAARANLGRFTMLPFFQRLLRASGFVEEADRAEQGSGSDALSDRVLNGLCPCRAHRNTAAPPGRTRRNVSIGALPGVRPLSFISGSKSL